ncbi:MAG TPA: inositol monophosphatase [Opitutaceae bacterium]|nr:inositol monophosphatase [Opitutaceae bacterium]
MTSAELHRARRLLCALQDHIRGVLLAAREKNPANFARVAAVTAADTIYRVDRIGEEAIFAWLEKNWPRAWPVELVMERSEGGEPVVFPRGVPVARTVWKCILDPIDGTRNLMYDKRSAWTLAALAPQRGAKTSLADIVVAAMTELPTSKQWRADQLSVVRGGGRRGLTAAAIDVRSGRKRKIFPRPSPARDFRHGFASLVKFFPEGKSLLARVEEELWASLGASGRAGALVFDDQYLTTGGQIYELLAGHDRMIADLRPLALAKLGITSSLVCHPYDICTALLLTEAGGVVEAPEGGPLRAPLDTTSAVAWVGYANAVLARRVRPNLQRLVKTHL